MRAQAALATVLAALLLGAAPMARANIDCGTPLEPGARLEDQSDLSLMRMAEKPASSVVCSMGYLAEKCGDHVTALKIFDKCIAQGYAGAMIWKGLMYDTGVGLPKDDAKAAALFRQAADSGEGHYAALGKLHYASALQEGRGVPRDTVLAKKWFERAAAEGSEDAAEFLRTGYHTGGRDRTGHGVGVPGTPVQGLGLKPADSTPATGLPWRQTLPWLAALGALLALGVWRARAATPAALPSSSEGAA